MILTFLYFPMCSKSLKELRNQVFEENEETENKEYRNISLYLVVMILAVKIVGLGVTICIRCVHNYWRYFAKKTFPWVSTQHEHSSPLIHLFLFRYPWGDTETGWLFATKYGYQKLERTKTLGKYYSLFGLLL